jgi:hypothetical protein
MDEKKYGRKDDKYVKLIEELKKSGAAKNELFEKQKAAREEFEEAKKVYNDQVNFERNKI